MKNNKYNGYANYMTFRIMHDFLDQLVVDEFDAAVSRLHRHEDFYAKKFDAEKVARYVRESLQSMCDVEAGKLHYTVWDYAMTALIHVDWEELAIHVNTDLEEKMND